jgi:hypothetical protein
VTKTRSDIILKVNIRYNFIPTAVGSQWQEGKVEKRHARECTV